MEAKPIGKAGTTDRCLVCAKIVYPVEKLTTENKIYHKNCFKCVVCHKIVSVGNYVSLDSKIYCKPDSKKLPTKKNESSPVTPVKRDAIVSSPKEHHIPEKQEAHKSLTPMNVIIAGPPAGGKGTQCAFIVKNFGLTHISTGDLLRAEVNKGTPLGLEAKEYMDQGALVPDEVIIGMVKKRLAEDDCKKGWLLDGFPRTRAQADAMQQAHIIPTHFVLLEVSEESLVERVVGRRSHSETGKIYHLKFDPPPPDMDPSLLIQRSDDTEEKIKSRIAAFNDNINSIIDCYVHILHHVDGNTSPDIVSKHVTAILQEKPHSKI